LESSKRPLITVAPREGAEVVESDPPNFPIAVRFALTMATLVMNIFLGNFYGLF
jgi:hypothetical protein